MLYQFLVLLLLLVYLKSQKAKKKKKAYKDDSMKVEIEVCVITTCSNMFTVDNVKLAHNMTH